MVYIFGLIIVFVFILILWLGQCLYIAIKGWIARRRQPLLPEPVMTQRSEPTRPQLSEMADRVLSLLALISPGDLRPPAPEPAHVDRRRSSARSGVVRTHLECDSDPELPSYTYLPSRSRPELLIVDDEDMPPQLTPRSITPLNSATSPPAPDYSTRPPSPQLTSTPPSEPEMTEVSAAPVSAAYYPSYPVSTYPVGAPMVSLFTTTSRSGSNNERSQSLLRLPSRPQRARRKPTQRGSVGHPIPNMTLIPLM